MVKDTAKIYSLTNKTANNDKKKNLIQNIRDTEHPAFTRIRNMATINRTIRRYYNEKSVNVRSYLFK